MNTIQPTLSFKMWERMLGPSIGVGFFFCVVLGFGVWGWVLFGWGFLSLNSSISWFCVPSCFSSNRLKCPDLAQDFGD